MQAPPGQARAQGAQLPCRPRRTVPSLRLPASPDTGAPSFGGFYGGFIAQA